MKPADLMNADPSSSTEPPDLSEAELLALAPVEVDAATRDRAVQAVLTGRRIGRPDELAARRRRRTSWVPAAILTVGAAAAAGLVLTSRTASPPGYGMVLLEGDTELGLPGAAANPPSNPPAVPSLPSVKLRRHAMLRIDFPAGENTGADDQFATWARKPAGGPLVELPARPKRVDGKVQLRLWIDADPPTGVDLEPGSWQLVFVFAKPGRLPDREAVEAALRSEARSGNGWRISVAKVEVGQQ